MIEVRVHSLQGPPVVVLHGGPAAAGSVGTLAAGLADEFAVLEPFQRTRDVRPLSVGRHISDLGEVIRHYSPDKPPALAGHSWGAMLALAFAAARPDDVSRLALIGCGTFDPVSRQAMNQTIKQRMTNEIKAELDGLHRGISDADKRLAAMGRTVSPIYDFHPIGREDLTRCDARAHEETWRDMIRRQNDGDYPAAFSAVKVPAAMFHGTYDPHPGRMIRESLLPVMPQLKYYEFENCGHSPWLEFKAREAFYKILRSFLAGTVDQYLETAPQVYD